jgi:hypothetical protein
MVKIVLCEMMKTSHLKVHKKLKLPFVEDFYKKNIALEKIYNFVVLNLF